MGDKKVTLEEEVDPWEAWMAAQGIQPGGTTTTNSTTAPSSAAYGSGTYGGKGGVGPQGRQVKAAVDKVMEYGNWGDDMYQAWKESRWARERAIEERKKERAVAEMEDCSFKPTLSPGSKKIQGRYAEEKWALSPSTRAEQSLMSPGRGVRHHPDGPHVVSSSVTSPGRIRGGTSLEDSKLELDASVQRLVGRFAGVGKPKVAYDPMMMNTSASASYGDTSYDPSTMANTARGGGGGRGGPVPPPPDQATAACLRLYGNAQRKEERMRNKKVNLERERQERAAEEVARARKEMTKLSVWEDVPSRWRKEAGEGLRLRQAMQFEGGRGSSSSSPGAFQPDTEKSKRTYKMIKRLEAQGPGLFAEGGEYVAQAAYGERGAGAGRVEDDAGGTLEEGGVGLAAGAEGKLGVFLRRQEEILVRKARTKARLAQEAAAARRGQGISKGSQRIMERVGHVSIADVSTVRAAQMVERNHHEVVSSRPRSAGPRYGDERGGGGTSAGARGTEGGGGAFQPKINARSKKMAPTLPADEHFELLYFDSKRREQRLRQRKEREMEKRDSEAPFKPTLVSKDLGSVGRLRVSQDPEQYLQRATLLMQQKEIYRQRVLRMREEEELEKCTFQPNARGAPDYVLRMAQAHSARAANGIVSPGRARPGTAA